MKNKNGFTLIELLMVISVIALLVALVLIAVSQVRIRASNSRIKGDMDQLRKQAEVIYAANGMTTYCAGGVNGCLYSDTNNNNVKELSDDIDNKNGSAGGAPSINTYAPAAYCISAVLADSKNICYDSTGKQSYGVGLAGTCSGVGACQ